MGNKFDKELELLVEVAKVKIPSLIELRQFGSYGTPQWREKAYQGREPSDVDVMALLTDGLYSIGKDQRFEKGQYYESEQREDLRKKIYEPLPIEFAKRLCLHIVTVSDMEHLDRDVNWKGQNFGKDMRNGKLLYQDFRNLNLWQHLRNYALMRDAERGIKKA